MIVNACVLRLIVAVPLLPETPSTVAMPVNPDPSPVNDPVNEPVNGSVNVLNCVEEDTVPVGSSGVTCVELDTIPVL